MRSLTSPVAHSESANVWPRFSSACRMSFIPNRSLEALAALRIVSTAARKSEDMWPKLGVVSAISELDRFARTAGLGGARAAGRQRGGRQCYCTDNRDPVKCDDATGRRDGWSERQHGSEATTAPTRTRISVDSSSRAAASLIRSPSRPTFASPCPARARPPAPTVPRRSWRPVAGASDSVGSTS